MASAWECPFGSHSYLEVELENLFQLLWSLLYETHPSAALPADHGLSLLNIVVIGYAAVPVCIIVLIKEVSLFQRFTQMILRSWCTYLLKESGC